MREFASHVAITQANQALTVNGTAFNIANSSAITNINTNVSNINTRINSINSSITNIDSRVTNIEEHGSGGSTVSFDQNTMTLIIDGTPYTVSDGSSLASAMIGKTLVQVAHKNV